VIVEVDPHLLRAGATMAQDAGRHIGSGADQLAQAQLPAGMFGDFAAAQAFHAALSGHHTQNVQLMRDHHSTLSATGTKAHAAAAAFVETDECNAEVIRAVAEPDS